MLPGLFFVCCPGMNGDFESSRSRLESDLRTIYKEGIASGPFSRHGQLISPSPFESVKVHVLPLST